MTTLDAWHNLVLANLRAVTNDVLLRWYDHQLLGLKDIQESVGHLEQEILRRIKESGGTMLPSETFLCELKSTNSYDQTAFRPFLELLNEADLETVFTPAHSEQVTVEDRWDTQKLIALARRYGDEAKAIIERAKVPSGRKLKFEKRNH